MVVQTVYKTTVDKTNLLLKQGSFGTKIHFIPRIVEPNNRKLAILCILDSPWFIHMHVK